MNIENLKYPLGVYKSPEIITEDILQKSVKTISSFPLQLQQKIQYLNKEQLNLPYRPEGWTIGQVVNHCADSHMNALIRVKLALTERQPVIKPYFEDRWAELQDSKNFPIESALKILTGVHDRWSALLNSLSTEQWQLNFIHPEHGKAFTLAESTCLYAWHCDHHQGHVQIVLKQLELYNNR